MTSPEEDLEERSSCLGLTSGFLESLAFFAAGSSSAFWPGRYKEVMNKSVEYNYSNFTSHKTEKVSGTQRFEMYAILTHTKMFTLPVQILQLRSNRWALCSDVVSFSMLLKISGIALPLVATLEP